MSGQYWSYNGLTLSNGNLKLGNDTIILNMGSAADCPSKTLGHCKVCRECYAAKAERLYPQVLPFRKRQARYWLSTTKEQNAADLIGALSVGRRAERIKWFRINESGDFWSQDCVDKLDYIAAVLKKRFGIRTYGYTARKDLDFGRLSSSIALRGSGHFNAPHGSTTVLRLPKNSKNRTIDIDGKRYSICPMDCRVCNRCKTRRQLNIVFPLH